jgi:DNA primase
MANERSVGTIWSEETENGIVLHMRVGTGADVMLTLPNAEVAAQAEAQLRSTLAMATMRFQRIAKETTSSGKLWEGLMPEETKAHIAEQAEDLAKAISEGRLSRALLAEVASFLHYPAMASTSRLAYLLKAVEDALKRGKPRAQHLAPAREE